MRHIWFLYALSYPRNRVNAENQLKLKSTNKTKYVTLNTEEKKLKETLTILS